MGGRPRAAFLTNHERKRDSMEAVLHFDPSPLIGHSVSYTKIAQDIGDCGGSALVNLKHGTWTTEFGEVLWSIVHRPLDWGQADGTVLVGKVVGDDEYGKLVALELVPVAEAKNLEPDPDPAVDTVWRSWMENRSLS
jgi:hypothetical protein